MNPTPLTIPLINPNEREAVLIGVSIENKQSICAGTLVATIESTKSTLDIYSDRSGFVIGLSKQVGDAVTAGDILCFLAESPMNAVPDQLYPPLIIKNDPMDLPVGLRITQPALRLAKEAQLDLSQFPLDKLITESMVRGLIGTPCPSVKLSPTDHSLILYGGGGHGKSLVELIRSAGLYHVIGIVDDGIQAGEAVLDVPVLGGSSILTEINHQGVKLAVNAVGGIGNLNSRLRVFDLLTGAGFSFPAVIHPRALCEPSSSILDGAQIFANAYVGSSSRMGIGCIINTGAIISHDCLVGDYSNISPGAILAGGVVIGEQVLVGMGVTINLNVKVGAGARIGNGATVKADVPAGAVVKAGMIWPG